MKHLLLAAAAASLVLPAYAEEPAPIPSPGEIAAAAPASDWIAIAPSDLLVMELAPDEIGKPRRAKAKPRLIVIQLMPPPFSEGWVGNIRKLAAAHWWDGTSVNRVQDNYVAQWGDATEKKPLPEGLAVMQESEYVVPGQHHGEADANGFGEDIITLPAVSTLPGDGYASGGFLRGWPFGSDNEHAIWPVHCYGAVGVGRNLSPDTGSGAELYAVIGHAPRHLDRNIAVVGRVISGIEHLSSLPRGTGALGFYESEGERVPIKSIRLASELPAAAQPKFEYLSTDSKTFARYADARQNRRDPFFISPAGGADLCNIPVPIRPVAAK